MQSGGGTLYVNSIHPFTCFTLKCKCFPDAQLAVFTQLHKYCVHCDEFNLLTFCFFKPNLCVMCY